MGEGEGEKEEEKKKKEDGRREEKRRIQVLNISLVWIFVWNLLGFVWILV